MNRFFIKLCLLSVVLIFLATCKPERSSSTEEHVVNIRLSGEPDQLNPLLTSRLTSKQIEAKVFLPLLDFDAQTLELRPVLATDLPVMSDNERGGRNYEFTIRQEARWDDGRPVTAEDVLFTWKLQLHPGIGSPGKRSFLSFIESIEQVSGDPRRLIFYTNRSFNLAEAVIGTMMIYPKHLLDPGNDLSRYNLSVINNQDSLLQLTQRDTSFGLFAQTFRSHGYEDNYAAISGCGPYRLQEWRSGHSISLQKKEDWWAASLKGQHQAFGNEPDRLIYHFVEDDVTLSNMLRNENIDVAAGIDPATFVEMRDDPWMQENYQFFSPLSLSYYYVGFNAEVLTLADPPVRRAIAHAIDVDKAIEIVMNGMASRIIGPILPVKSYYRGDIPPIRFDLEQSRSLLDAAGWQDLNGDGTREKELDGELRTLQLTYKYPSNNIIGEQVGLLLQTSARQVGIDILLEALAFDKLVEDARARDFDLYFGRWSQVPGLDDLRNLWHTASDTPRGFNRFGFGDAETDAIIDSINVVTDFATRIRLYHRIQGIIFDRQPYIFLFAPKESIIIHKKFKATASAYRPGYFAQTFEWRDQ